MIYACVITFNPDLERLKDNLQSLCYQSHLDGVIIVDNGSSNINDINSISQLSERTIVIHLHENMGIAKALNIAFTKAIELNADWVLTCDQDSIFPPNLMDTFYKYISLDNSAILCPMVYDENAQVLLDQAPKQGEYQSINQCITSGALTNVSCWKEVGGFDDFLFIDSVDFDFCYRLKRMGYSIYRISEVKLSHSIGKMCIKHFGPLTFKVLNHSAFRKYYILRNRIYCDFKSFGHITIRSVFSVAKQMLLIICFEDGKKQKLLRALSGIKDGFHYGFKLRRFTNE